MVMYMHNVTMCTSVHVRACPCENHDIRANLHGRCTDVHGLARIFLLARPGVTLWWIKALSRVVKSTRCYGIREFIECYNS